MNQFPPEKDQGDEVSSEKEIEANGEDREFSYQDEMRDLRRDPEIHRLNHRITLLSILVPSLLGAILLFAYLEVNERLDNMKNVGSRQLQALSTDVVDKIASLSDHYESLTNRLLTLEKSFASIKQDLKRDERAIGKLTVSKIDKNALEKVVRKNSAEIADTFKALRKDLDEQNKSLESLVKELKRESAEADKTLASLRNELRGQKKEMAEVAQVIETMRKAGQEQESAIRHLSGGKVDKEEVDNLLKNEMALLETQIQSLKEGVLRLEKQADMAQTSKTVPDTEGTPPKEKPAPETTTDAPAPARIIEQEITE